MAHSDRVTKEGLFIVGWAGLRETNKKANSNTRLTGSSLHGPGERGGKEEQFPWGSGAQRQGLRPSVEGHGRLAEPLQKGGPPHRPPTLPFQADPPTGRTQPKSKVWRLRIKDSIDAFYTRSLPDHRAGCQGGGTGGDSEGLGREVEGLQHPREPTVKQEVRMKTEMMEKQIQIHGTGIFSKKKKREGLRFVLKIL